MGIKLGICGYGRFSVQFLPVFQSHPLVDEVVVADLVDERRETAMCEHQLTRTCASLEALCDTDVDAIAIFSQRHLHGPQTLTALNAGKHVWSAVPIGISLEEIEAVVRKVEQTGLIYMTAETSYYYPAAIYCRQRFERGEFGRFVYGEAQYHHDMSHFYASFQSSGGKDWKKFAGIPPMYYPTHSISQVLSVTGSRATQVSCMGVTDHHEDGIFKPGVNNWNNTFSNQCALMRTNDGGALRINEMRRIGWSGRNNVYMSLFGTKGSYEENAYGQCWSNTNDQLGNPNAIDLTPDMIPEGWYGFDEVVRPVYPNDTFTPGTAKVHPIDRLPAELLSKRDTHLGSHRFLIDDFVQAVVAGKHPPCHVWNAARWMIPGLIAHESAKQGGKLLDIPDFGGPPGV